MKVIGIGDNVVDKYMHLNKMFPGGNALNFSVYAQKLGYRAAYMGVFGDDEAGRHIRKVLDKFNIDISHCRVYDAENGFAKVNLVEGDRVFVGSNNGGIATEKPLVLSRDDIEYIWEFDLVHSSCFSNIEGELHKLKGLDIPISYDFSNHINTDYLAEVCPKINYGFLSCGHLSIEETKKKLIEAVNLGCDFALGTRGEKGAILYYQKEFYFQEAYKVDPIDTLGAGDSFITSFLLSLLKETTKSGEVIGRALASAARFAAETCLVQGAFENGKTIN